MNKIIVLGLLGLTSFSLTACDGCPLIAGCNGTDNSPYYMTTVSNQVRGIPIPPQTKLTYQSQNFRQKFEQTHALKREKFIRHLFTRRYSNHLGRYASRYVYTVF